MTTVHAPSNKCHNMWYMCVITVSKQQASHIKSMPRMVCYCFMKAITIAHAPVNKYCLKTVTTTYSPLNACQLWCAVKVFNQLPSTTHVQINARYGVMVRF